jgi:hypothetical protein
MSPGSLVTQHYYGKSSFDMLYFLVPAILVADPSLHWVLGYSLLRLVLLLNGTGAVCDHKLSKFFVLHGRVHGKTHGYKWSLLKIREGSSGAFKIYNNLWKVRNQVISIQ